MVAAQSARARRKLIVSGVALMFGAALFLGAAGCDSSDDFDFRKSEGRMSRSGLYGAAASDTERRDIQEGYAKKIEEAKVSQGGG